MSKYEYGGKTEFDYSNQMGVVDLIPLLLEKKDTDGEMLLQYQKYTDALKLNSIFDLMTISYNQQRNNILIARACHFDDKEFKFQLHIPSSATSKYIFNLGRGCDKYLNVYESAHYCITVGCHAQESQR